MSGIKSMEQIRTITKATSTVTLPSKMGTVSPPALLKGNKSSTTTSSSTVSPDKSTNSTSPTDTTKSSFKWDDLKWWNTGEADVVMERLHDLRKAGKSFNPPFLKVSAALNATPFDKVRVVMMGQDPYPESKYCTGLAFSIPKSEKDFPKSLQILFDEYENDLGLPRPAHGDLAHWAAQGVLLWNAIPTCEAGKSLSHYWPEWMMLTEEIVEKLVEKGCVFVFMGQVARDFSSRVSGPRNRLIETTHPSPRGIMKRGVNNFPGSRIFSRTNDYLNQLKLGSIDWRLK